MATSVGPRLCLVPRAGHEVTVLDNYLRRNLAQQTCSEALIETPNLNSRAKLFECETGKRINVVIGDCRDYKLLSSLMKELNPEALMHYAEQPSGPYSMKDYESALLTFKNNLGATFNVIWAVLESNPNCHIIKLGTMGEYGTPNIDIEEGWLDVEHRGRKQKFLYPRQAGTLYHTTKVLDTDLLWFYVRTYGLRVTDLMQGPVYGLSTPEAELHPSLVPNFHYDDIFGTVVNRFLVQAIAGIPLTVYGTGGQTRGYLNLLDTLQCVNLAMETPADPGELRIFNQFTEQFTVNELAKRVQAAAAGMGITSEIKCIDNPRQELEEHYYNAAKTGLLDLGLKPHFMTEEVLSKMLEMILPFKDRIDLSKVMPRIKWK